jgi:hypothetical protein
MYNQKSATQPLEIFRFLPDLSSLVLSDLVLGVLLAILAFAVRPAGFRNVDLYAEQ